MLFAVSKVELDGPCSAGEVCLDENAECVRGTCRCERGYFKENNQCSELHFST